MRAPIIERPIYLNGAPIPETVGDKVTEVCKSASPFFSLIGATLLGATAAYFVPKFFDHYLSPPESDNVELEVEPRDD